MKYSVRNDDNSLFQETHGTAPPSESSIFSDSEDYDKILYEKFVKKCQRFYKLKTFVKPHYKGLYA